MKIASRRLREAYTEHMIRTQDVYGTNHIKPKAHWMFDVCDQLDECDEVIDSYAIERNHIFVKSVAEHITRRDTYETSLLSSVTTLHRQRLAESVDNCLLGRKSELEGCGSITVANCLTCNGLVITVGDFVLRGAVVGEVITAALDAAGLCMLVEVWEPCGDILPHSKRYSPACKRDRWPAEQVVQSVAWYFTDGDVTVLTY